MCDTRGYFHGSTLSGIRHPVARLGHGIASPLLTVIGSSYSSGQFWHVKITPTDTLKSRCILPTLYTKPELLDLWKDVISKHSIPFKENSKVEAIIPEEDHFRVETLSGDKYTARSVLLAIGRRGSPRKLNIPGEELEKVAYRLLEPEIISGKDIMVVGGGDSAIETALLLSDQNKVILSYRGDAFGRIKPKNKEKIEEAAKQGLVDLKLNTNLVLIEQDEVTLAAGASGGNIKMRNDLVYIFAGGELPTQFLVKIGLQITKKFGEAVLKHR